MLLLLGVVALFGLKPWEPTSLSPDLSVSPEIGVGVGDAAAVARASSAEVAAARVAGGGSAAVASKPVAYEPARPDSRPSLGVSQARVVQVAEATPVSPPPAATQPVAASPAPAPSSPPPSSSPAPIVATVNDDGAQGDSGTAGADEGAEEPLPDCEGEYTVTISYTVDEATGERLPTEILIQRVESDGSVSELHLEGDLTGYRDLISALVADGSCVRVVFVPCDEGGAEPGEAPEAGAEAVEPVATLEPAVP